MDKFQFTHQFIDTQLDPERNYAQTALADLDNDGRLEYIVGQQFGDIFWYKFHHGDESHPMHWRRHLLGSQSPSDVGVCVLDVDGDGWIDLVTGGAWYRNSRSTDRPFTKIIFDASLSYVHDMSTADIDGDGRMEILTMSDQNSLRWYKIPSDPTQPWILHEIGPAVHAGMSIGDVDGDGDLDIVRTDIWLENVRGDGSEWIPHAIGPNTPPPSDFQPYFAFNATYSVVCDMNGNGKNDVVFSDAEIPGGKIWWMENVHGDGTKWLRHEIFDLQAGAPRRGAYHSLFVGDLDGDGDLDVFSCEMEAVSGDANPRYYIWENVDGKGQEWREHVILDANLGGHAAVLADIRGIGKLDIITKPWRARKENALGGKMFIVHLENHS